MSTGLEMTATEVDHPIPAPGPSSGERFIFIDGLRGVAASAVLFFHVFDYVRIAGVTVTFLPMRALTAVASYGFMGVEIFFVLSGFVIAHSLRRSDYSMRAIARFALRRSVRLDPPYWATIAFVLLSALAGKLMGQGHVSEKVSAGAIVAHLLYLQDILHIPQLITVFWTLCMEVQFYLVYVLAGYAATKLAAPAKARLAHGLALTAMWIISMTLAFRGKVQTPWFIGFWFAFMGGVVTYWFATGRIRMRGYAAFVLPMLVLVIVRKSAIDFAVLATMLLIALAARRGALSRWLSARPVQFLGAISYSLYLIHTPVIALVFFRLKIPFGRSQWTLLAFTFAGSLASLAAALVLYRLVERPSHTLAKRLGRRTAGVHRW